MFRCVLLSVLAALAATAGADVFEDAQWLRDPRMAGEPVLNFLLRGSAAPPEPTGPRNVHTLLRKSVQLKEKPTSAQLFISGDDYYKFSINGLPVVQGPEGGYHFSYPYYWLDVTDFLEAGDNCLASHAFYQGLRNRVWCSADNRSGFIARLEVSYADSTTQRFVTDKTWRVHELAAFPGEVATGYSTQFLENIDMRAFPAGWDKAGFDDTTWVEPLVERQDHVFIQQATQPLQRYRLEPAVAKELGGGGYFYDFGSEVVGHTVIQIQGEAGHPLIVRHGEQLDENARVRFKTPNLIFDERPVLSGGQDTIAFYDYRAFRYIEILDAPVPPVVWVKVRHHPFDARASQFTSSDASLQNIFAICKNAVQMGSQGGFLDCPSREKGQYLGDAVITARSHLWLTGDGSLTRKALYDFYLSCQIHPGMMAVAPGHFMQEIAEFPLQFPLMLENYYQHTGDSAMLAAMADTVFPGLFKYYAGFEKESGLIEGLNKPEKWLVVDWPGNLRDGYDYDYASSRANTVLNAFYYGGLRAAARMERILGRDGQAYDARADRVAAAFTTQLADPATGLFLDAPGSKHSSLHANAIPLVFGLTAGVGPAPMLELIRQRGLNCSPYIASYVIEACFKAGAPDLGFALLTNDSDHGWKEMLRMGATAATEVWNPSQKKNMSWCHPWASSPIYLIAERVFGLTPGTPGWGTVRIAPPVIANLPEMSLTVPHPKGPMTVSYALKTGYTLAVPEGVPVEILAAEGVKIDAGNAEIVKVPPPDAVAAPSDVPTGETPMTESTLAQLKVQGWEEKVGEGLGVWVDVARQRLTLIERNQIIWEVPCATATAGTGSVSGSLQTPLGWHRVDMKLGDGAPWGQVFRSRIPTKEIWKPGDDVKEDLVLTRVLWLDGMEPGKNKGKTEDGVLVDSKERCIYIHGTNGEAQIGTPSSHGCIRLFNDDVIKAFEMLPEDTPVLITK
jgi:lipoprotein-anchoring transpeptidase ErfK/SrfK